MNTNSNTYTIIYSTVLVVVVAAILAFAAEFLKPAQQKNIKVETISKVLTAALQADENLSIADDATDTDIMEMYAEHITDAYFIDAAGQKVGESMNLGKEDLNAIKVTTNSDLKAQNDLLKAGKTEGANLPVYQFDINGQAITVVPCYGAGLWGPIWGYVAVAADGKTIKGAIFDHKSETPGLGAKIAEEPFYSRFAGKELDLDAAEKIFNVEKGQHTEANVVDAISGATITSQSLGRSLNRWFKAYKSFFNAMAAEVAPVECDECTEGAETPECCQAAAEEAPAAEVENNTNKEE